MKTPTSSKKVIPKKNWFVAVILSFFLGSFGVDRMYLGCIGTGIIKFILFFGLFGLWSFIDFIRLLFGDKLCGGFEWEKSHSAFSGGSDKISLIVPVLIGLTLWGLLMYFFGYDFAMRKYREYTETEETE
jgi:hypothetical protein